MPPHVDVEVYVFNAFTAKILFFFCDLNLLTAFKRPQKPHLLILCGKTYLK